MTLTEVAERNRLKIRHDECGDPIVLGRQGHLYVDEDKGELCLMVLNGKPLKDIRLAPLEARKVWKGDISRDSKGRRCQDVEVLGIPESKIKLAMKIVKCNPKQIMSPARAAAAASALAVAREKRVTRPTQSDETALKPVGEPEVTPVDVVSETRAKSATGGG